MASFRSSTMINIKQSKLKSFQFLPISKLIWYLLQSIWQSVPFVRNCLAERRFSEVSFSDQNLKVVNILASCNFSFARHKTLRYLGTR